MAPAQLALEVGVLQSADYVFSIRFPTNNNNNSEPTDRSQAQLQQLLTRLHSVGFHSQARAGSDDTLLVFVKADDAALFKAVKSLILKDYLYGLSSEITDDSQIAETLTHAEKLRVTYGLLTNPESDGGAGITPRSGPWEFVDKIIPIHDYKENSVLLKQWLTKPLIDEQDLLTIREIAGEKVALYFGFLRFYFLWLLIPTALGLISHLFFKRFSIVFTVLNSLWAITFINAWKKKESIYAAQWNTKGSSKIEVRRADFIGEVPTTDPATGLATTFFPEYKRTFRKIAFIPTALIAGVAFFSFQVLCFFIEIFLTEVYQGPGKIVLALVPTIMIVVGGPIITGFYQKFIDKAVKWENHETQSSYDSSVTEKLFVLNFLGSYIPLLITIFAYLPYGHVVNTYLPLIKAYSSRCGIPVVQEKYQINSGRLTTQFEFFAKTSLLVGFLMENVVPVSIRLFKEHMARGKTDYVALNDAPEEAAFLKEVRKQVALPAFDVNAEYRELAINFGYLVIFGPVWSLAPLFSLISNYVEIKGDLEKLLAETSRPVPTKAENIDPWNTNLRLLTWIGTLVGPVTTVFFRQQNEYLNSSAYNYLQSSINVPGWKAASAALISENISIVLNVVVETSLRAFTTQAEQEHTAKTLRLRRSYVESYAKQTSLEKRDTVLDPSSAIWARFNDQQVLKQAYTIPVYLKQAKDAQINIEKSEKDNAKPESTTPSAPIESVDNISSGSQRFGNDFVVQSRKDRESTTASKSVPATDAPIKPSSVPIVQTTTDSPVSAPQKEVSTAVPQETGSGAAKGVVTGATLGSVVAVSSTSSEQTSEAALPAEKSSRKSSKSKPDSKKKKGLFGFGKKEKSIRKAVKEDSLKVAKEFEKIGKEAQDGDLSGARESAKELVQDAKAHPEHYAGQTKEAIETAKHEKNDETKPVESDNAENPPVTTEKNSVSTVSTAPAAAAAAAATLGGVSANANPSKPELETKPHQSANGSTVTPRASHVGTIERKSIYSVDSKNAPLTPDNLVLKNSRFASDGVSTKSLPLRSAKTSTTKAPVVNDGAQKSVHGTPTPSISVADETTAAKQSNGSVAASAADAGASAGAITGAVTGIGAIANGKTTEESTTPDPASNSLRAPELEPCANSSAGSLNGATLPPNFGSKKSSSSSVLKADSTTSAPVQSTDDSNKRLSTGSSLTAAGIPISNSRSKEEKSKGEETQKKYTSQQTGYTGATGVDAFDSQPNAALDAINTPSIRSDTNHKTLDPAVVQKESVPSKSPSRTPANEDSHPTKTQIEDSKLKPASCVGAIVGGQSSDLAKQGQPGYLDQAKELAGNTGSTLNDYAQKAAEKVDDYAQDSKNQYVAKGNEYIQQAAQKSDEIANNKTSGEVSNKLSTPTKKVENRRSKASFDQNPAYNQFVNKAALGETTPTQPSIPSFQSDEASSTTESTKKTKRSLFGTIKHKVKSNHSTPNKRTSKKS